MQAPIASRYHVTAELGLTEERIAFGLGSSPPMIPPESVRLPRQYLSSDDEISCPSKDNVPAQPSWRV